MANLIYVIGASGVGKDSLLSYVRQHEDCPDDVIFCHRYITREVVSGGENHIALSAKEFKQRLAQACFAMSWYSHQNHYGIGIEINHWLKNHLTVVVNGSRGYLPEARQLYPDLKAVLIEAELDVVKQRLETRARETSAAISSRIELGILRNQALDDQHLFRINNNGDIAEAGQCFLNIIREISQRCN